MKTSSVISDFPIMLYSTSMDDAETCYIKELSVNTCWLQTIETGTIFTLTLPNSLDDNIRASVREYL